MPDILRVERSRSSRTCFAVELFHLADMTDSHERLVRQFDTNLFGPINLTRSILPHFRAKKAGTLVYIGSQAGWRGDPSAGSYCASKFALEGTASVHRHSCYSEQTFLWRRDLPPQEAKFNAYLFADSRGRGKSPKRSLHVWY